MSTGSWQATTPRIFESDGREGRAPGVPHDSWFTVASVLVQYILGAAAQNAANGRFLGPDGNREEFPAAVAT